MMIFGLAAMFLCACGVSTKNNARQNPKRPAKVMSLNACADQLLVSLGEVDQIDSLTYYAKDKTTSPIRNAAASYPTNHMLPEEIINRTPDLILAGPYVRDATTKVIGSLGIKTEHFGVPVSIAEAKEMVNQAGIALHRNEKARRLNREIDDATSQSSATPITALVYYENGYSAGANTLIDEVMTRSGLKNMATIYGVGNWGHVDLEQIIANPPQILILPKDVDHWRSNPMRNHESLGSRLGMKIAYLPDNLGYCGGEVVIGLANELKRIRGNYATQQ